MSGPRESGRPRSERPSPEVPASGPSGARVLHYVADPMCSWCWGFASELAALRVALPPGVELRLVLGGLAPDSDAPMPAEMRAYVQQAWRDVEARTGARFNREFWERCEPRRSTYPACRAVIAAGRVAGPAGLVPADARRLMYEAIQRAYYLEARNPSLTATLIDVAREEGLPSPAFGDALSSEDVDSEFRRHRAERRRLGVDAFPSLVLEEPGRAPRLVMRGSGTAAEVLAQLA